MIDPETPPARSPIPFRKMIFLVLFLLYLPQIPGCFMTYSAKRGKVVDAVTGKGIPGVAVMTSGTFLRGFSGYHGSGGAPRCHSQITFTDEEGRYWQPSHWQHFFPGIPGVSEYDWGIRVLKPGYIVKGDEWSVVRRYPDDPFPPVLTDSAWWFGVVNIWKIPMIKDELTLKQRADYFREMMQSGICGKTDNREIYKKIKNDAYQYLLLSVCDITQKQEEEIDVEQLTNLVTFTGSSNRFIAELGKFDSRILAYGLNDKKPKYQREHVCQAMKITGGVQ